MNISSWVKALTFVVLLFSYSTVVTGQTKVNDVRDSERLWLDSEITHNGDYQWKMIKAGDVADPGEKVSLSDYPTAELVACHCARYSSEFIGYITGNTGTLLRNQQ